jgi:sec-independent protein translocase protein TatA
MGALRPWHIIVLVVVILLLFGARRLPDLARSVGQSLKIFKNEVKDLADDDKSGGATFSSSSTATSGTATSSTATSSAAPSSTATTGDRTPGLIDPREPKL